MISRLTVILSFFALGIGAGVFELKASVLAMQEQLEGIEAEISKERLSIRTLEADWAHVSRPERLVQLAHQVGMVRAGINHVVRLDHIGRRAMLEMSGLSVTVPLSEGETGTFRVKPMSRTIGWESWQ